MTGRSAWTLLQTYRGRVPRVPAVIARVDAARLPELERWFRRVLDAASIDEVLASNDSD